MMLHELCRFVFEFVCYAMCSRFNLIFEGVVKVVKVVKCCETICCNIIIETMLKTNLVTGYPLQFLRLALMLYRFWLKPSNIMNVNVFDSQLKNKCQVFRRVYGNQSYDYNNS